MFKTTALLTMLTLGTSASIAMAAPRSTYDRDRRVEATRATARHRVEPARAPAGHRFEPARVPGAYRIEPARPVHTAARIQLDRTPDRFARPVRDDRDWDRGARDDIGPRHYRPTWIALSAPVQLSRAGQCIEVRDPGTFTQLRLQSDAGVADIDRVIVQFADGSTQVADLDRALDQRGELVEIPLDGNNRRIDRITVTGATGDLQVFAI